MDSPTLSNPQPKQPLVARLGFFVLGGVKSLGEPRGGDAASETARVLVQQ